MRILHVLAGAKNGGSEAIMLDSVLALAEAGVAQHVVTRDDDALRLRRLKAADIPYSIADFDKIVRASTTARIRTAVRGFEPDVLHFWMARAAGFAQPKWREISLGWHGAQHKLARFSNCAWHAVAAPSLAARLIDDGIKENRVTTLSPYMSAETSPPAFDRGKLNTPDHAVVVFAPGFLDDASEVLVEALARVDGIHLWHSEPISAGAKTLAKRLDVSARVHHAVGEQRAQLMDAADIVVALPTTTLFDSSIIEAWGLNKPVIAFGAETQARDETDALIVPRLNGEAIATAIQRLLSDGDLAQRLRDHGRRLYQTRFTKAAFVRNAMAIYETVRAGAQARREREAAA